MNLNRIIDTLVKTGARSATYYDSPKMTVRVSRKVYRKTGRYQRGADLALVLSIGSPNHQARQFIKRCKKAGQPFPIGKIQLRFPAKR